MPGAKLPVGRLSRLARLAAVGARTGASLLASKDGAGAAEYAADVLGNLRGLAAKIGQMASYVDGFVPEEHRAAYERALGALRAAAPRSEPSAIRRVIEEELRAPIDDLFAEFDDTPFASASIGQVHRARLHDARAVAVKVQHPGIDDAVRADLANGKALQQVMSFLGPRNMGADVAFADVVERILEELDYTLEAENQTTFRGMFAGDPHIRVPEVVAERSGHRVLTSALASGRALDEVANDAADQRRAYAEVLWRFVFTGNLVAGRFNADPHPGNYLFGEDGTVTFLDFGCVQPISEPHRSAAVRAHRAAMARDEPEFERAVKEMLGTRGGPYEKAVVEYSRELFQPLFSSPFHITRPYVAAAVRATQDLKAIMWKKNSGVVPIPKGMAFMNRLQFGFYSVLARLDVEVDYARIERAFLGSAG